MELLALELSTPSLLFSAISLILLAYTNRFLSYASVVRGLKEKYEENPENDPTSLAQIRNFVKRLRLIRAMQILGVGSLLFCLMAMFFLYIKLTIVGDIAFGLGMIMLAASLVLCIFEVQISTEALSIHLQTIRQRNKEREAFGGSFRRIANRREGETLGEYNNRKHQEKQRRESQERKEREAQEGKKQKDGGSKKQSSNDTQLKQNDNGKKQNGESKNSQSREAKQSNGNNNTGNGHNNPSNGSSNGGSAGQNNDRNGNGNNHNGRQQQQAKANEEPKQSKELAVVSKPEQILPAVRQPRSRRQLQAEAPSSVIPAIEDKVEPQVETSRPAQEPQLAEAEVEPQFRHEDTPTLTTEYRTSSAEDTPLSREEHVEVSTSTDVDTPREPRERRGRGNRRRRPAHERSIVEGAPVSTDMPTSSASMSDTALSMPAPTDHEA